MSKIAALAASLGVAPAVLGGGLALLGSLGSAAAQRRVADEQEAINNQWVAFQQRKQAEADLEDARLRDNSYESLADYLDKAGGEARTENINTETDRLTDLAAERAQATLGATSDALFAGDGANTGSAQFKRTVGKDLQEALGEARDRVRALMRTSAYGGSYGGMGITQGEAYNNAAEGIGFNNELRGIKGNTLNRFQQIEPERLQYQSTGFGELLTGIGGSLLGTGDFGGGGAAAGFTPTYSGYMAPTPSAPATATVNPAPKAPAPINGKGPRLRFGLSG